MSFSLENSDVRGARSIGANYSSGERSMVVFSFETTLWLETFVSVRVRMRLPALFYLSVSNEVIIGPIKSQLELLA